MNLHSNEQPALPGPVFGLCRKEVTRPDHTQGSIQEEAEAGNATHRGWPPLDTADIERLPSAMKSLPASIWGNSSLEAVWHKFKTPFLH